MANNYIKLVGRRPSSDRESVLDVVMFDDREPGATADAVRMAKERKLAMLRSPEPPKYPRCIVFRHVHELMPGDVDGVTGISFITGSN